MCERKLISYRFKQWKQWKRLNNKTKNKITRFLKSTLNIYSINFPIVDESSKNFCRFNKNINSACHIFFAKEYYKYYKYITFGFTIYINIKTVSKRILFVRKRISAGSSSNGEKWSFYPDPRLDISKTSNDSI